MRFDQDYFEGRTSYFYQWGGYRDVGSYFDRLARWFRPHVGDGPLLDVGCAYGFLLSRFDDGCRPLCGCDVSEWAVEKARGHVPAAGFRVLDGSGRLPYEDGRFEAVVSTDVLEHIARDGQATVLDEVARVLAPGGRFCMTTPNLGMLRQTIYRRADRAEEHIGMRHITEWARTLERHGFRVIDRWTYLNGFLPGRTRRCPWLPEAAVIAVKAAD